MPEKKFIDIDPQQIEVQAVYKLLIGSIIPRPIALISTINKAGQVNLAPFSFFNGVSSKPPCIMFSVARKADGSKKDTLINIEETGEFVINSANKWYLEKLVHCAAGYDYGVNEMEKAGLCAMESKHVKPPWVKESALQMECVLYNKMEVGHGQAGSATIVVGEIKLFRISSEIYKDGKIDPKNYNVAGRLGGINYCDIGEIQAIPVPVAK